VGRQTGHGGHVFDILLLELVVLSLYCCLTLFLPTTLVHKRWKYHLRSKLEFVGVIQRRFRPLRADDRAPKLNLSSSITSKTILTIIVNQ
jgi:hypothetical protein